MSDMEDVLKMPAADFRESEAGPRQRVRSKHVGPHGIIVANLDRPPPFWWVLLPQRG